MKKTYIMPTTALVEIKTENLLSVASTLSSDPGSTTSVGFSNDETDESGCSRDYYDDWD